MAGDVDLGGKPTIDRTQQNGPATCQELAKSRGGERITQGRDGQTRDKDTIRPAKDPRKTKG